MAQSIRQLLASRLIECKDAGQDLTFEAPDWLPESLDPAENPLDHMIGSLLALGMTEADAKAGLAYQALANIRTELRAIRRGSTDKEGRPTKTHDERLEAIAAWRPTVPTEGENPVKKLEKLLGQIDLTKVDAATLDALRAKLLNG